MEIKRKDWKWLGYAGHFCQCYKCKFSLATEIGDFLVSTIGDMHNDFYDDDPITIGGEGSFYETMVFSLKDEYYHDDSGCRVPDYCDCIQSEYYMDSVHAREGHMKICKQISLRGY